MKVRRIFLAFVFSVLFSGATAAEIMYTFTGKLNDPFGTLPVGTPFNGFYTYDENQPLNTLAPDMAGYKYMKFSVTIGGTTVIGTGCGAINLYNDPYPSDMFHLYLTQVAGVVGGKTLAPGAGIQLVLQDLTKTVFSSLAIPGSNLSLNNFTTNNYAHSSFVQFNAIDGGPPAGLGISARGELTSLTGSVIPNPPPPGWPPIGWPASGCQTNPPQPPVIIPDPTLPVPPQPPVIPPDPQPPVPPCVVVPDPLPPNTPIPPNACPPNPQPPVPPCVILPDPLPPNTPIPPNACPPNSQPPVPPQTTIDKPLVLGIASNPIRPNAGQTAVLSLQIRGTNLEKVATFSEGSTPLPGCTSVPVQALPGSSDVGVAYCKVAAIAAGNHVYTASAGNASATHTLSVAAQSVPDYTDMWWVGAAENGWGMSITQHGLTQFVVFFVYDNNGQPIWYAMPGGSWNADFTQYTGDLYLPSAAPFSAYDTAKFTVNKPVGTATISYSSLNTASVTYTINGIKDQKSIQRQLFGPADTAPRLQINDLWWGGMTQNGWGVNIAQQERTLFPIWYTYDQNGKPTWFVMPGGTWNGNTYTGTLYQPSSSPWLGTAYDTTRFLVNPPVGSMSFTFTNADTGVMTYSVNGITQTKDIVRQPY